MKNSLSKLLLEIDKFQTCENNDFRKFDKIK
jgi:hypothetical protein